MDLQNVKNITIPEGSVNNIHDQNGRLLWGRLAYDTKYAGDTFQQTYSGNNLFNRTNASENTILTWAASADNTENGTLVGPYINVNEGDKFISNYTMIVFFYDSSSNYLGVLQDDEGTVTKRAPLNAFNPKSFTVPSGYSIAKMRIEYRKNKGDNPEDMVVVNDIMLNSGETLLPYEPYVGGTASPNPDYPQDIDVVTGTQTVQITAGTESEDFTVNLGTIELCKLGDYQDYIYKSGDDWYVHKEIRHQSFAISDMNSSTNYPGWKNLPQLITDLGTGRNRGLDFETSFISNITGLRLKTTEVNTKPIYVNTTNEGILYLSRDYYGSDHTQTYWRSNYSGLRLELYYGIINTPTDTQITDNTLITQLNTIHKWLTRYGYLSNVTGNLPLLINQTNL